MAQSIICDGLHYGQAAFLQIIARPVGEKYENAE